MRTLQTLVFDDMVDDSTPLYISPELYDRLAGLEELTINGTALGVSGSSPTVSVQIEESPDQIHWRNKRSSPEINAVSVSLTTFTNLQARDSGNAPSSGYVRLRVEVGGASSRVHVKLWVTLHSGFQDFSPEGIAGLVAWFDMQDPSAFTLNSTTIDSVTNKVSAQVVTQTDPTRQPTYAPTGLNGHPCGDYDGAATGDQFIGTEASVYNVFSNDNPFTLFYVAAHHVADRIDYVFCAGGATTNGYRSWGTNSTAAGVWLANANQGGVGINVESSAADDTNPHVFEWWTPGGTISLSLDGGVADPNASAQVVGALTLTKFSIGVRSRGGTDDGDHDGLIGEILLWSRELSADERAQVRTYLGAKWSIALSS